MSYTYMPSSLPLPSSHTQLFPSAMCASLDLRQFLKLFLKLGAAFKDLALPSGRKRKFYERIFCPLVTLWGMVFQRLLADPTLEKVVVSFAHGKADVLRPGRKGKKGLSKKMKSRRTTSFCNARTRLPLELIQKVFIELPALLCQKITGRSWKGWNVLLLDGSTVRLPPLGDIPKSFKPHSNQHKCHWCLMRVVVGFCLRSGLALGCTLGSQTTSEQILACGLILAAQAKTLIVGDRNFGVFRIAQVARQAKAQVLVRLTKARALRLARQALVSGLDLKVLWTHSRHDKLQPKCSAQPVEGRLIVCKIRRPGFRPFDLYLFTTLVDQELYSVQELVALYGLRWHVELNLRYLKAQMNLGFLRCKSAAMAQKEWYAGLIAYNLIRAMMLLAATKALLDPLSLSFSSSAREVLEVLMEWAKGESFDWEKVLKDIATCRLPKRKQPRPNEPRLVRHVRETFGPLRGSRQAARKKLKKVSAKC
ncbi:MAG: IS4 family transposase [Candidatus Omnitrophota bacterium]|nr:IS4 family transposase [Candidatus Omnitrophota bacterium]